MCGLLWMWSRSSCGVEKDTPVASHSMHTSVSGISDLREGEEREERKAGREGGREKYTNMCQL